MKDKEKQIAAMEQYLVQSIVCSKSWKPRDIIEHLTKMIIPENTIVLSKEEYEKQLEDKYYEGYHEGYSVGYYYGKQDARSADKAEPTNNNKTEIGCDEFDRGYIVGKVHGMLSMLDSDNEVKE